MNAVDTSTPILREIAQARELKTTLDKQREATNEARLYLERAKIRMNDIVALRSNAIAVTHVETAQLWLLKQDTDLATKQRDIIAHIDTLHKQAQAAVAAERSN